ncbi:hypothetical protein [Streptomyces violens]|uniref:hypothetical protein n=1 Tax=Streptomyces violens TaxID=66377 RepID=UPI001FDF0ADA|nr:hypothetical protein [Streptomyces violens]
MADARGCYLGYPEHPEVNARVVLETAGTFPELLVDRICTDAGLPGRPDGSRRPVVRPLPFAQSTAPSSVVRGGSSCTYGQCKPCPGPETGLDGCRVSLYFRLP